MKSGEKISRGENLKSVLQAYRCLSKIAVVINMTEKCPLMKEE